MSQSPEGEFDFGQRQTLLMIKAFLASESLFFLALILGYVYYSSVTQNWATAREVLFVVLGARARDDREQEIISGLTEGTEVQIKPPSAEANEFK